MNAEATTTNEGIWYWFLVLLLGPLQMTDTTDVFLFFLVA